MKRKGMKAASPCIYLALSMACVGAFAALDELAKVESQKEQ